MYIDNLITPATIGKRRRLYRILGSKGRGVIVPLDDSLISSDNEGLKDLEKKIIDIEGAKPNGILCYYGTASLISKMDIPLIINISASTVQSQHTKKVLISTIKQAVAIDAAAVAVHINISSKFESEMLTNLGTIAEASNTFGMPLFAIIYPRKEKMNGDDNYLELRESSPTEYTRLVAHCARIAFELGADIIKTQYTGSSESFAEVVSAAGGRPVFIAGGKLCEEQQLYDMVADAMKAGASGVSIGRNIFNRNNASEIICNIQKIVFS